MRKMIGMLCYSRHCLKLSFLVTLLCMAILSACGNPGPSLSLGEIVTSRTDEGHVQAKVTVKNLGNPLESPVSTDSDSMEELYCVKAEWYREAEPDVVVTQSEKCIQEKLGLRQFVELELTSKDTIPADDKFMIKVFFSKESSDRRFEPTLSKTVASP